MNPNFLFIGPDKSGSTWIYDILSQHPNCFVPSCKEIFFFDRYYHRGLDWYLSIFNKATSSDIAIGEISHDYLFSKKAAEQISIIFPDIKLLVCLRHPVLRTFSHYLFLLRSGLTKDSFEETLKSHPELIEHSMYFKHLNEYFNRFSRDQIKILYFSDLQKNPIVFAKEIFIFLGLPFIEMIKCDNIILPASRPRNLKIAYFAKLCANLLRDMRMQRIIGSLKRSKFYDFLYIPLEKHEKPIMTQRTANDLLNIFRDDTMSLQKLLNKDLSNFLILD